MMKAAGTLLLPQPGNDVVEDIPNHRSDDEGIYNHHHNSNRGENDPGDGHLFTGRLQPEDAQDESDNAGKDTQVVDKGNPDEAQINDTQNK